MRFSCSYLRNVADCCETSGLCQSFELVQNPAEAAKFKRYGCSFCGWVRFLCYSDVHYAVFPQPQVSASLRSPKKTPSGHLV